MFSHAEVWVSFLFLLQLLLQALDQRSVASHSRGLRDRPRDLVQLLQQQSIFLVGEVVEERVGWVEEDGLWVWKHA